MSALGQEQTCAPQKSMSALPLIATAKADIGNPSCLLYPQKRTCAVQPEMSALGQKRTCSGQRQKDRLAAVSPKFRSGVTRQLHRLDLSRPPSLIEPRLQRTVEAHQSGPALAGDGLHPVVFLADRSLRSEIDIY